MREGLPVGREEKLTGEPKATECWGVRGDGEAWWEGGGRKSQV